jgi:hypothetical protein
LIVLWRFDGIAKSFDEKIDGLAVHASGRVNPVDIDAQRLHDRLFVMLMRVCMRVIFRVMWLLFGWESPGGNGAGDCQR